MKKWEYINDCYEKNFDSNKFAIDLQRVETLMCSVEKQCPHFLAENPVCFSFVFT